MIEENTARDWRDIADELTGQQCIELAALEREGDEPATLLFVARSLAVENLTDAVIDIPKP